jgi:SAM-dependent methyltransferase
MSDPTRRSGAGDSPSKKEASGVGAPRAASGGGAGDSPSKKSARALNDEFAREHDIDAYYATSSPLIRAIERRRLSIIRGWLTLPAGATLLEIGVGGGHVLRMFPRAKLTGVDVSSTMLEKARRNLAGLDATLLEGDLAEVGLADASFDAAICTEVLEHTDDPRSILAQLNRLLKPTGRAVVTFPNDPLIHDVKGLIRRSGLPRLGLFRRVDWGGDHYHLHVWKIPEMRALLSEHFEVEAERHAPSRVFPIRCCFLVRPRRR